MASAIMTDGSSDDSGQMDLEGVMAESWSRTVEPPWTKLSDKTAQDEANSYKYSQSIVDKILMCDERLTGKCLLSQKIPTIWYACGEFAYTIY